MKFFSRTDKVVIKDAQELPVEEFVNKYKPCTQEEILSRAYFDIRKANPVVEKVTEAEQPVSVIKEKKVFTRVITKAVKPVMETDEEEDIIPDLIPVELLEQESEGITVKKLAVSGDKSLSSVKKKVEIRTSRIKELLKEKMKPKLIIAKMATEGITVHFPQITAAKQAMENTKKSK